MRPRGGQRYVLVCALYVSFLISDLISLTSLVGYRSMAAGSRPWMLAAATMAWGLLPGMWTRGGKRCVLSHAFFKSDLTLPRPQSLLLQDSGVRPQDHG